MDSVEDEFSKGVNAYWGGSVPDGWESPEKRARSPYLMGWYMASMWEVEEGFITDQFGDPIQENEWDEDNDSPTWS